MRSWLRSPTARTHFILWQLLVLVPETDAVKMLSSSVQCLCSTFESARLLCILIEKFGLMNVVATLLSSYYDNSIATLQTSTKLRKMANLLTSPAANQIVARLNKSEPEEQVRNLVFDAQRNLYSNLGYFCYLHL